MSTTPSHKRLFESGLQSYQPSKTLDSLINQHLEIAAEETAMDARSPPTPPAAQPLAPDSANLLNELGEYFSRTAKMWSSLTQSLIQGPHIERIATDVHSCSIDETLLMDFSAISAVDVEISRLRKIRDLSAKFSQDVEAVWNPEGALRRGSASGHTPASTFAEGRAPLLPALNAVDELPGSIMQRIPPYETSSGNKASSAMDMSEPDGSDQYDDDDDDDGDDDDDDDDEELFASIDMEALKQRGKGSYYCPKGSRCDKGGVDKDGHLVRFGRNSSFMQHCNKHRKPWRCDKPGCPNHPKKRRFARRDGLERHVQTVRHIVIEGQS